MNLAVIAAVAGAALATTANANLFANAGFEDPITQDGPPFVGSWEAFSGGGSAAAFNGTASPLSGAQHAEIQILGDDNNFAGMFQDVVVTAGEEYTFSGFHATPSNPLDVGIEYRIEWRDSVNDVEISRTPNATMAPSGSTYEMFSLSATAPAGANLARVVYAIQTFAGDGPTNSGVIYLDDVSFIPAPGSLAILAGAGLGVMRRRR